MRNRLNQVNRSAINRENIIRTRQYEAFNALNRRREQFRVSKKNFHFFTYFLFIVIRIVLVFLPQYGYIHPDEFFQTTEVIAGKNFITIEQDPVDRKVTYLLCSQIKFERKSLLKIFRSIRKESLKL